ncbi:GNAT family N-acetyltransferase [Myxococcota bacterium]|nr:GNAT family N-acetyltransferase [Myxococcota bacterium]MBU1896748.1 GNAT family N-acetyltransferase [Myxococcota bacterium]
MSEALFRAASALEVKAIWARWGGFVVTPTRVYHPNDVRGGFVEVLKVPVALATWAWAGERGEIVTLDAFQPARGFGAMALAEAERALRAEGVLRVSLITTNDNPRALKFYLLAGYRLIRLHLNSMDRVRVLKPKTPKIGQEGVPLMDMWELEKILI